MKHWSARRSATADLPAAFGNRRDACWRSNRRKHAGGGVGTGAYGYLEVTSADVPKWTKMKAFEKVGKKTDMFIRFSTVASSRGGPDVARDPRGFAMKYYTEDGNWDLAGKI